MFQSIIDQTNHIYVKISYMNLNQPGLRQQMITSNISITRYNLIRYMSIIRPRAPHFSLSATTATLAVVWMVRIQSHSTLSLPQMFTLSHLSATAAALAIVCHQNNQPQNSLSCEIFSFPFWRMAAFNFQMDC